MSPVQARLWFSKLGEDISKCRAVLQARGWGACVDQLTLSQPGGHIMSTTLLHVPPHPIFRPWDSPNMVGITCLLLVGIGLRWKPNLGRDLQ